MSSCIISFSFALFSFAFKGHFIQAFVVLKGLKKNVSGCVYFREGLAKKSDTDRVIS